MAVLVAVEKADVDCFSKNVKVQRDNWSKWQDLLSSARAIVNTQEIVAVLRDCVPKLCTKQARTPNLIPAIR